MRAGTVDIRQGDVLDRLREMPDGSVQCVVTSPPYWSLRDYGTGTWEGGAPECEHVMAPGAATGNRGNITTVPYRGTCGLCGAVRVDRQLGLEPTIEEYIERMVEVFREVWRVLRSDGTLWLNMGDCYCSGTWADRQPTSTEGDHVPASWAGRCQPGRIGRRDIGNEINGKPTRTRQVGGGVVPHPGPLPGGEGEVQGEGARLKSKDLVGQGWRLAFALQEDGWWLRSDIIWHKPNPMPECLDPSTQVFIRRNGWVSRVTLGQAAALAELPEILSPTGWVRIRRLWHVEKEAMTLGAGKVERVICSPDHRFPVSSDRRRVRTRLEPASAIRHEGYADYLLYCPIRPFLVPTITEWGGRPLDYDIGFLVGAYVAEGGHDGENGRRIKLTLGLHEEEFKAHLHERLAPWGLTWSESIHGNSVSLRVSDDGLERFFDAFVSGQVKTKSLNMELLLNCPEDFRRGVLDGYVQGDGTPGRGGGWRAVSASERLRDDLSTLASSLGIITSKGARVTTDERTGNTYYAWSLSTPYMTRRRVKSGTDGVMQVPPRCRRMILGTRQMIDLEVEGGVFLIGDGLLTHNSVHDRPTRSHEYLFLLTKSARYYYDADAVREPLSRENEAGCNGETTDWDAVQGGRTKRSHRRVPPSRPVGYIGPAMGRNLRDVWTVRSEPFPEAHFATFPVALVEPCIAAGVSEGGACPGCGARSQRRKRCEPALRNGPQPALGSLSAACGPRRTTPRSALVVLHVDRALVPPRRSARRRIPRLGRSGREQAGGRVQGMDGHLPGRALRACATGRRQPGRDHDPRQDRPGAPSSTPADSMWAGLAPSR